MASSALRLTDLAPEHTPSLAQLISAAFEAKEARSAILCAGDSHSAAIDLAEDTAWEAMQELRGHLFNSLGLTTALQRKLGELLA